jgi:hypothetical protein
MNNSHTGLRKPMMPFATSKMRRCQDDQQLKSAIR